jgi:ribosome-associated protein
MFNDLQHTLKQEGVFAFRKSGTPESGWMVLDYIDVVIHIFLSEIRDYYALEDLWPEAPRLAC